MLPFLLILLTTLLVIIFFIKICFSASSLTSAINVPSLAIDTFPDSSETTIAIASDSLEMPTAALCLVPRPLAISLLLATGKMQAAASILLLDITTAPS